MQVPFTFSCSTFDAFQIVLFHVPRNIHCIKYINLGLDDILGLLYSQGFIIALWTSLTRRRMFFPKIRACEDSQLMSRVGPEYVSASMGRDSDNRSEPICSSSVSPGGIWSAGMIGWMFSDSFLHTGLGSWHKTIFKLLTYWSLDMTCPANLEVGPIHHHATDHWLLDPDQPGGSLFGMVHYFQHSTLSSYPYWLTDGMTMDDLQLKRSKGGKTKEFPMP